MPIRAADLLHLGRGSFLLSRLQNAGPSGVNVPTEIVKELGDYKSVAVIRDVPDLTFTANSFDVSTDLELMLTNQASVPSGGIDMSTAGIVDIVGLLKPGIFAPDPFTTVGSIACPMLYPEKISYKFQVKQNSTLDLSLRGDSIYYCPGTAYTQTLLGSSLDATAHSVALTHASGLYTTSYGDSRVLSVSVNGQRQNEGKDFTATSADSSPYSATTVTFLTGSIPASTDYISITYFSNVATDFAQTVHPSPSVIPAAVRGRDVRVYIGATYDPANPEASAAYRWTGVQSITADWAVTVEQDYELGSEYAFSVEAQDVQTLNGMLNLRARTPQELQARLRTITGVTDANKAVGPDNAVVLPIDIVVLDSAGTVHKRLHIPDARFNIPGYNAQISQRVDVDLNYTSDTGSLYVFSA